MPGLRRATRYADRSEGPSPPTSCSARSSPDIVGPKSHNWTGLVPRCDGPRTGGSAMSLRTRPSYPRQHLHCTTQSRLANTTPHYRLRYDRVDSGGKSLPLTPPEVSGNPGWFTPPRRPHAPPRHRLLPPRHHSPHHHRRHHSHRHRPQDRRSPLHPHRRPDKTYWRSTQSPRPMAQGSLTTHKTRLTCRLYRDSSQGGPRPTPLELDPTTVAAGAPRLPQA